MKKFITMALCFVLAACVLIGCGRKKNDQTTDTTTTPTTFTTQPTTNSTAPTTDGTVPSTSTDTQGEQETSSVPGIGNDNMGENSDDSRSRSHSQFPRMNGGHR